MNLLSSQVMARPGFVPASNVIMGRFARPVRAEPRIDPSLPRKAKNRVRGPYFLFYNLDRVGGPVAAAPASEEDAAQTEKGAPAEGTLISDRYELVTQIGVGGMGIVWRARDKRLGRAVAVKVLSSASVGNDIARTRLIREARAAAALEHEGIIRVYDVGETPDGGAFLVMELIRGKSLRAVIEERTAKLGTIAHTVVKAARALQFAHDAGIVHRDMKPDNIMIRDDGRVTVVDFGVAKPIVTDLVAVAGTLAGTPAGGSLTGSGMLVGTPAYLAPEQARGQAIGPSTDQFALAVTAYEALTGARPWTGSCFSEVIASLLRDAPPPVSSVAPVPKAVDDILARAMAKEASARFDHIGDFADALEEAAASLETDPIPSARAHSRRSVPQTPVDAQRPSPVPASGDPKSDPKPEPSATLESDPKAIDAAAAAPSSDPLVRTGDDAPPAVKQEPAATPRTKSRTLIYAFGAFALMAAAVLYGARPSAPRAPGSNLEGSPAQTATSLPAASREAPVTAVSGSVATAAPVLSVSPPAATAIMTSVPTPIMSQPGGAHRAPGAVPSLVSAPRASTSSSAKPATSTGPAATPSATGRRIRTDL